jgi:transposase
VHTLICRGSGLPLQFLVSPANVHDSPFTRPLLEIAVNLYKICPRVIHLDAAYWGLRLIGWIHETLGAVAVIPWNPKRAAQTALTYLRAFPKEELGKRSGIERFFGRVFLFFRLQCPLLTG